jgi:hypothetical protein
MYRVREQAGLPDQVPPVDPVAVHCRERAHGPAGHLDVARPERPDNGPSRVTEHRVKIFNRQGGTQPRPLVCGSRGKSFGKFIDLLVRAGQLEMERAEFGRRQVVGDPRQRARVSRFGAGGLMPVLGRPGGG